MGYFVGLALSSTLLMALWACKIDCPNGQIKCDQGCVEVNEMNCGACGNACADGYICSISGVELKNGTCVCPRPLHECKDGLGNQRCSSLATVEDCGKCGRACAENEICAADKSAPPGADGAQPLTCQCPPPLTKCPDGACVDIHAGDPLHCGSCTPCAAGESCSFGECLPDVPLPDGGSSSSSSSSSSGSFPAPTIDDVADPAKGYAHLTWVDTGQKIAVLGHHFFLFGEPQVALDGQPLTGFADATPTVNGQMYDDLELLVPSNITNGVITVTTQSGTATFTMPPLIGVPTVTSINPPAALAGGTITLTGDHFTAVNYISDPTNGSANIAYVVVDEHTIKVTVDPLWQCPAYFQVENPKGTSATSPPFTRLLGGSSDCVSIFDCRVGCLKASVTNGTDPAACYQACNGQAYSVCGLTAASGAFNKVYDPSQLCSGGCGDPAQTIQACETCIATNYSGYWTACTSAM